VKEAYEADEADETWTGSSCGMSSQGAAWPPSGPAPPRSRCGTQSPGQAATNQENIASICIEDGLALFKMSGALDYLLPACMLENEWSSQWRTMCFEDRVEAFKSVLPIGRRVDAAGPTLRVSLRHCRTAHNRLAGKLIPDKQSNSALCSAGFGCRVLSADCPVQSAGSVAAPFPIQSSCIFRGRQFRGNWRTLVPSSLQDRLGD
jgi:hypothetical protein